MQIHPQTITDCDTWNSTLALLPSAHVLQTWEWGDFKAETTGWKPHRIAYMHKNQAMAMAQILTRQEGPFQVMYVPKGPVLDWTNQPLRQTVIKEIKRYAHDRQAIFIKIDPDIVTSRGEPGAPDEQLSPLGQAIEHEWSEAGFHFSDEQIQFRNSVIIDLRADEESLLMNMKSKTRYNVRLADKRAVTIRYGTADDLDLLYDLYKETAVRDDFVIRPLDYYRKAWADFMRAGLAQPIIAEWKELPLAHVIIFGFGNRAWYFYGASSNDERNRMPTYALQWHAIQWARQQGMQVYDFWGAPENFADEDDPLLGVYRFKSGFGGTVVRPIGAWDYPARPTVYQAYNRLMPVALNVMRAVGRRRLQDDTVGQPDTE